MKPCSICTRSDRAEIDRSLVTGVPLRELEARHTGTTRSALDRHRKHIPSALTQAKQAERVADATSVLSRLERLLSRCEAAFDRAMQDRKSQGVAAAYAREIRGCLELLAKLSGELQTAGRVAITLATIQNLDIGALTREQIVAVYERVEAERSRQLEQMTDDELEVEIMRALAGHYTAGSHEALLFDEDTVPAPENIETWYRSDESLRQVDIRQGKPPRGWCPHRDATAEDRHTMLKAAWKRITGSELGEAVIGPYASIQIEFDLTEGQNRYWESWPKVKLHVPPRKASSPSESASLQTPEKAPPQVIEGR